MSKCECCKEENSKLITFRGRRICPACYMCYVSKVKVCENNAKYETEIDQLKQQLEEKDKEIAHLKEITIFKDNRNMTTKINGIDFSDEQIITLQNLDVLKRYDQTQLAIQELEKVKNFIDGRTYCADYINKRIQDLKGD